LDAIKAAIQEYLEVATLLVSEAELRDVELPSQS
jgi:hypothetical protein